MIEEELNDESEQEDKADNVSDKGSVHSRQSKRGGLLQAYIQTRTKSGMVPIVRGASITSKFAGHLNMESFAGGNKNSFSNPVSRTASRS